MLQLFAHPFSSFCWKVLIALYENATPFDFRMLDPQHPENGAEWARRWPLRKLPVLVDGERTVVETDAIIEHLDRCHPGPMRLLPDAPAAAVEARMMTRIADDYVMTPTMKLVADALRPPDRRDPFGVEEARAQLGVIYGWLDGHLAGRAWTAGEAFSIADCALAPAIFYADWAEPIPDTCPTLRGHRARLLARPSVARCIDAARPFRPFFPLGAPDRD
ncbi:glutathione S-transferase family protein [uncultured Sphingomonas sp.]|uniref:glutathione S-transferase family protein n=1 Tax=uncultured Sphingomonas sp. TaxID=158754 RepID=UPI0035C956ED